jgi:carboxymethylenebutenolidase
MHRQRAKCNNRRKEMPMSYVEPSRRQILQGLAATAPLAAILSDPDLARAVASALEDVNLQTAGGKRVHASLALPADTPAAAVLLIHEWWGLNDQIKSVASELAREGYAALAADLYEGKVASSPDEAERLRNAVDPAAATDTLVSWVEWLQKHPGATGRVATIGWCFGGGWSLNTSIATPVDATIVYYGQVDQPADRLARLKGPVLGHFATRDQRINQPMVERFETAMAQARKPLTVYWYDADHAFANPTGARYDAEDAKLAWDRSLTFLRANLHS